MPDLLHAKNSGPEQYEAPTRRAAPLYTAGFEDLGTDRGLEDRSAGHRHRPLLDSCPVDSVLQPVCRVVAANTDLPVDGVFVAAATLFGAKLAALGVHAVDPGGKRTTPSISTLALSASGCDLSTAVHQYLLPMMPLSELTLLPDGLRSNAIFEYLYTFFPSESDFDAADPESAATTTEVTAALFALRPEGVSWISQLGERAKSTNPASTLRECRRGVSMFRWSPDAGSRRTRPVRFGFLATSPYKAFVESINLECFEVGMRSVLMLFARERPGFRRATYRTDGILEAEATVAAHWEQVIRGPRTYEVVADAMELHERYFQTWNQEAPNLDETAREHAAAAISYGTILKASSVPDGRIDRDTMQRSLEIVDRHFRDRLHGLREEIGTVAWERRRLVVESYMRRHPEARRGEVMRKTRCGNSKDLTNILEAIAEIHQGTPLGDHAARLARDQRRKAE
jgi:hypothetical protein